VAARRTWRHLADRHNVFAGTVRGSSSADAEIDVLVGGDPRPSVPANIADGRLPSAQGEALFSGSSFDSPVEIDQRVKVEGVSFKVVGTADDAAFNVLPTLYVPYEDYVAASQARASRPVDVAPSLIGVKVAKGADPAKVARSLTKSIDGVEALDRSEAVAALPGVGQITQSFSILYLLLYIVVALVTGVFFLILTVQKEDALVLLRAVGASSRDVIASVLIQVLVVVGLGALIGRRSPPACGPHPRRVGAGSPLDRCATSPDRARADASVGPCDDCCHRPIHDHLGGYGHEDLLQKLVRRPGVPAGWRRAHHARRAASGPRGLPRRAGAQPDRPVSRPRGAVARLFGSERPADPALPCRHKAGRRAGQGRRRGQGGCAQPDCVDRRRSRR
jgi:hypothetical protein